MNDLQRINEIEKIFGVSLKKVEWENLFDENTFQTSSDRDVYNYSIDENGFLTGLVLDFLPIFVLKDNYLSNFSRLQKLKLRKTYLNDYSFLSKLKSLTTLNLSSNRLSDITFLSELKTLTTLDLRDNNLKHVSSLRELKSLTTLYLTNNRLKNISSLEELKSLITLNLSSNNLDDISPLRELKSLKSLYLSFNELSDISALSELTSLATLYLSSNNLSDISPLGELRSLKSLNLSSNNLYNVSSLKTLRSLAILYLNNNHLSDVSFLGELKSLTSLYLSSNNLNDVSFLRELKSLALLNLDNNAISYPPREIVNRGLEAIQSYYKQLEEEGKDYIYEAKTLIVGEPGAGKSTLFEKMKNPNYLPQNAPKEKKESTVGVKIETLSFPYSKDKTIAFKAHLWDFGGQPIQYVLHQYFFTERSLYVLLADDRRQLTNFHYWFEIIATLGKDCPVLVVLNELNHKSVSNFDLAEYRREFSEKVKAIDKRDVDFSMNEDGRFSLLKKEIENKLCNLEHIGQELPATWVNVREEIEERSKSVPYIEIDEYYAFCKMHGVKDNYRKDILRYFHDLGVAINYENDDNLEDIVILSPNWVIDALYVVLRNKYIKKNNGKFHKDFVFTLWEEDYKSKKDRKFLLSLMQKGKFEVAYKIGKTDEYIVPALLPFATPEYYLDKTNIVQVYFEYIFMPPGILSRLIVRLNENIVEQQESETKTDKQIVWEKGVLLETDDSVAEIIESTIGKQLKIKVSGDDFIKNKEFLTIIRNEIRKIHKDWFDDRLSFKEKVYCICKECEKSEPESYTLDELEGKLRRNKRTIECRKSDRDVKVRELLEGVYTEENEGDYRNINNKTFKIADNLTINASNVNFAQQENGEIRQESKIINNNINEKLDMMLSNLNETQKQDIEKLAQEIMGFFSERLDKLNKEQRQRFESLKNTDWKGKIKLATPFINELGIGFELEKEFEQEVMVKGVRKFLYGDETIALNILNSED